MKHGRAFLGLSLVAVGLTLVGAEVAGYRLNMTASMPYGIWRGGPLPARLERGMIVIVCLPDEPVVTMALERRYVGRGRCTDGIEPLLKPVAAVPGDVVSVTETGVAVNGTLIPNSAPKAADPAGRHLTAALGDYQVAAGEYWAIAPYPWSFDSRYFGRLPLSTVMGAAAPVITWR